MPRMIRNKLVSHFHPGWLIIALLGMLGVLLLTHIPQDALPRVLQHTFFDKLEHVAAYGIITLLFVLSLRKPVRPLLLVGILLTLAVTGIVDEITQPFVNRHASIVDYLADLAGISVACVMALVARRSARSAAFMGCTWRSAVVGSWRRRCAGRPGSADRATGPNQSA